MGEGREKDVGRGGVERGRRGESRERGMAFLSFLLIPFFSCFILAIFLSLREDKEEM